VVAQGTYQFGATTRSSPAEFTIPNQAGNVLHLSGRAANCNGVEAPYEISPLTRYAIGGANIFNVDAAPPSLPTFGLTIPDNIGGVIDLAALGFPTLSNVATVTAGTYTVHYLDELNPAPLASLAAAMGVTDQQLSLTPALASALPVNSYILIDSEIIGVPQSTTGATLLTVTRAAHGTIAAAHSAGASIFALIPKVFVVPFPKEFFGSPASGDWTYSITLPNVRVASAELFVTNSQGNSPISSVNFTHLVDGGLRTLSGGTFSFQVPGFLAVQTQAAPDIIVNAPKVVGDVYAVVNQAPVGAPIVIQLNLNGNPYCSLTIPAGKTTVPAQLDGVSLPPMNYQDQLSINIQSVGSTVPGSDLTVIMRV
jgi:hypothetical protein